MKATRSFTPGFLAMLIATGTIGIADSYGAHPDRVDVIATSNKEVTQVDSQKHIEDTMRVDVIKDVRSHGPAYSYTKPMSH